MTKILFVCRSLNRTGGVEKSFMNMIDEISSTGKYDIDVLAFDINEYYADLLNGKANIIKTSKYMNMLGRYNKDYKIGSIDFIVRSLLCVWCRVFSNKLIYKFIFNKNRVKNKYDYAVSYIQASNEHVLADGTNQYVLDYVEADKKMVLIHSDYIKEGFSTPYHRKLYERCDTILTVSESCRSQIIKAEPDFADKVVVLKNFQNIESIKKQANLFDVSYDDDKCNIVVVARLTHEKGIDRLIRALAKVNKDVVNNICIHLVGDGDERESIESLIEKLNISDNVKLYGNQTNPYPFIKKSDCLLISSQYEAAPMVIGEAFALGRTVVTTNTLSAKEQIEDLGIICDNSEEGLCEVLTAIAENPNILDEYNDRLLKKNINNAETLAIFEKIFEEH